MNGPPVTDSTNTAPEASPNTNAHTPNSPPLSSGSSWPVSSGLAARFEDDHRRFGRPPAGVRVESRIDGDPLLPQPITLLPRRRAGAHQARLLVRQSNDAVRVRLEVAPPCRMALVPAVHRD